VAWVQEFLAQGLRLQLELWLELAFELVELMMLLQFLMTLLESLAEEEEEEYDIIIIIIVVVFLSSSHICTLTDLWVHHYLSSSPHTFLRKRFVLLQFTVLQNLFVPDTCPLPCHKVA
jgi:hypothetical protein